MDQLTRTNQPYANHTCPTVTGTFSYRVTLPCHFNPHSTCPKSDKTETPSTVKHIGGRYTYLHVGGLMICSVRKQSLIRPPSPLSASTFDAGFIIAESAEMGLRMGWSGSLRSKMTTCAVSPTVSRMQMNLSDSSVRLANPMDCTLTPLLWSCSAERNQRRIWSKGYRRSVNRFYERA